MHLNIGEWLAVGALIVATVGIPITVWATRRWGTRRRSVEFSHRSVPIIPKVPAEAKKLLQVTYRDLPVHNPHLLTVSLGNSGPVDIASDHFDAGKPLIVRLNCKMYGIISTTHPQATVSTALGSEGILSLEPILLKRGEKWTVEAVVSGVPKPELTSPLIDTDVQDKPHAITISIKWQP
jgi:hypothetical protein